MKKILNHLKHLLLKLQSCSIYVIVNIEKKLQGKLEEFFSKFLVAWLIYDI